MFPQSCRWWSVAGNVEGALMMQRLSNTRWRSASGRRVNRGIREVQSKGYESWMVSGVAAVGSKGKVRGVNVSETMQFYHSPRRDSQTG